MDARTIKRGLTKISSLDQDVAEQLPQVGYPLPLQPAAGLEPFLYIIVNQQISYKAAKTILSRLLDLLPEPTAEAILTLTDDQLRQAGLSRQKTSYVKGLAQAVIDGSFNPPDLENMDDEAVIESITQLRGFGRWSAENYLIFSLGRKDVFPADDLILLNALHRLKNLAQRPTPAEARDLVAHWSPWRSVGSLFLWRYFHSE